MSQDISNYFSVTDTVKSDNKLIGTQDDSEGIQYYWNSTLGSDVKNKYINSHKNAFKLDIGVTSDPFLKIKHARNGTAGNVISWNEHFVIKKGGQIGMGVSNPKYRLDVGGTMRIKNNFVINGDNGDYNFSIQDGSGRIQNYWNSSRGPDEQNKYLISQEEAFKFDLAINKDPYYKIKFAPKGTAGNSINWNEHLTIRKNGWVGINKADPKYRLDVGGTMCLQNYFVVKGGVGDYNFSIQDGSGRIQNYWNSSRGTDRQNRYLISNEEAFKLDLSITNDPYYKIKHATKGTASEVISWNEHLTIKQNGNVGISTVDPCAKLDVTGSINFTTTITKNGNALNLSDIAGSLTSEQISALLATEAFEAKVNSLVDDKVNARITNLTNRLNALVTQFQILNNVNPRQTRKIKIETTIQGNDSSQNYLDVDQQQIIVNCEEQIPEHKYDTDFSDEEDGEGAGYVSSDEDDEDYEESDY